MSDRIRCKSCGTIVRRGQLPRCCPNYQPVSIHQNTYPTDPTERVYVIKESEIDRFIRILDGLVRPTVTIDPDMSLEEIYRRQLKSAMSAGAAIKKSLELYKEGK